MLDERTQRRINEAIRFYRLLFSMDSGKIAIRQSYEKSGRFQDRNGIEQQQVIKDWKEMDIIIRHGGCGCNQSLNEFYLNIFMMFTERNDHMSFTSSTSIHQQTDSSPSREYIHLSVLLLRTLAILSEDHPDFS